MVGIASQNENSAAERRSAPNSMAPTMVAPERDTPGIMARHWQHADAEIHRQRKRGRFVIARLEIEPVDQKQNEAADDEHDADDAHVEQMRLDERVGQRADHRRRQEGDQHADDEARRRPIA